MAAELRRERGREELLLHHRHRLRRPSREALLRRGLRRARGQEELLLHHRHRLRRPSREALLRRGLRRAGGRRTTAAGCQSGRHPDSDGQGGRRCVTTTAGSSSSDYQGGGGGRAAGSGSGSGRGRRGSCTALLVGHTASRNPRQGSPTRRRFGVQVGEATRHQRPLRRQGHRLLQLRRTSRQALLREPVTPKTNHSPRRRRTRVWNGRRLRLQRRALLLRRAHTSRHHDSANPPHGAKPHSPSHKHRRRPRSDSTRLHYGCLPRLHQFEPAVHGAALLDLHLRFPVGCQAPYQLLATPSLGQSRRCAKPYEQDLVRRPALGTSFLRSVH
ncbi:Os12g0162800 [Oryza sativa Japonica Group]|uniref:Os12g0162800 protein n=1 Tax=Oryza sativa subsp. japonica TaxID=39947 RepID=Q0IPX1_ORYSJ|nr:Os12g0162800 [Oryza sativa Japonica Group]|eukprot:NP_001066225.1 Os12g0162800 [Oryza sativa Japonica Group]